MGRVSISDLKNTKRKLETLLELSNRHSAETEIEGINPKSNLIIDERDNKVKEDNLIKEEILEISKLEN